MMAKNYELIDLVDESDHVIGVVERTPEWDKTRPTIHRLVHVFVWNKKGALLLQRRSRHKNSAPLLLDASVGGLVTSGLRYEEAAAKEMEEELGIRGKPEFILSFPSRCSQTGEVKRHQHLFEYMSEGPYSNWEKEAEELVFMTKEEINESLAKDPSLFTKGFQESYQAYKKKMDS